MQAFTQKTLSLAILSGVLLASAIAASAVSQARLRQAQADAQQLTQAEARFVVLKGDLVRWQTALASARSDVTLRQEPLDLSVALPPEQLYELPPILSKVFDPQGYFSLKQFKFEWKTAKDAGVTMPGQQTLAHITLQGDRTLILNAGNTTP